MAIAGVAPQDQNPVGALGEGLEQELGVQPVSKDQNEPSDAKAPQAVPPASTVPDLEPDPALARARQSKQ